MFGIISSLKMTYWRNFNVLVVDVKHEKNG